MKRFQDCNPVVKLFRYRHYLAIPFKWLYFSFISKFEVTDDQTLEVDYIEGKELWGILTSLAQVKMKWFYSHEEVMAEFDDED